MQYVYLLIAVALEVCGTMLLPVSQNFSRPVAYTVPDWVLRGLFLLFDLRPEYAADRGGIRHMVWAGDFSHHACSDTWFLSRHWIGAPSWACC